MTDYSLAMLRRAPAGLRRVAADVRRLPVRDAAAGLVVGLNAVADAGEIRRVLRPDGRLLWASSYGADTPLYVSPEDLLARLGPGWRGLAGRAGYGVWSLYEREA